MSCDCSSNLNTFGLNLHVAPNLSRKPNFTERQSAVSIGVLPQKSAQVLSPPAPSKDQSEREWAYLPRWRVIIAIFVFFAGASLVLEHLARTNTRGHVIDALIPLSVANATSFYWILSAPTLVAALGAIFLAIVRIRGDGKRKVAITRAFLVLPASRWSNRLLTIDYRAIRSLSVRTMRKRASLFPWQHRLLQLDCTSCTYSISSSQLPSNEAFDEICTLIAARMPIERRPGTRSPRATMRSQATARAG